MAAAVAPAYLPLDLPAPLGTVSVRAESGAASCRALLVAAGPAATAGEVRAALAAYGPLAAVVGAPRDAPGGPGPSQSGPAAGAVFRATFRSRDGLLAALAASARGVLARRGKRKRTPRGEGLESWIAEHSARRPPAAALKARLDDWFVNHQRSEADAAAAAAARMASDGGWTVVAPKRGRHKTLGGGGIAVAGVRPAAAAASAGRQAKPAEAFYRFQARDGNREKLLALRERFAADQKKVAELKRSRQFLA